jgi:hypothetical protein
MSGRRSYPRFDITPSSEGVLRVLRDVVVQRAHDEDLLVIGREAGVVGDVMTLEIAEPGASGAEVQVVESLPVIVDGTVRHSLRLRRISGAARSSTDEVASSERSST